MNGSPIYRDTLALAGVLLEDLAETIAYPALCRRLEEGALRLLDQVTLALCGLDRRERLETADAELQALRAQMHLAFELRLLSEDSFLALAEQADAIGRQIGGWLRKVRPESGTV